MYSSQPLTNPPKMPTIFELLAALAAILIAIYFYITQYCYKYFQRKGIPQLDPKLPFGNADLLIHGNKNQSLVFKDVYNDFKQAGARYGGMYMIVQPTFVTVDPEIVRHILVKDFAHFVDRGFYHNEKSDPLSAHMFTLEGQKWKSIRGKLSPTFTSGKMKYMFETVVKCSEPLHEHLEGYVARKEPLDAKRCFANFTVDVIGSCAFGLDCNSFKEQENKFYEYGMKAVRNNAVTTRLKSLFSLNFPKAAKFFNMKISLDEVEKFYFDVVRTTLGYRKEQNQTRKDFMQLLIELFDQHQITFEEVVAEAFLFFLAGFETSSTTGTFCLFELAQNQEVQQKLRDEIRETLEKNEGHVTYEAVHEMKYMSQVVDETLRKYPPLGFLTRKVVKPYTIPGTDITLDEDVRVFIPSYAMQTDPEYYPEPEKFDPERFNEENKKNHVPFTYLPFGDGPRNCIGMRFGLMQTKIGLLALLRNHKFRLNPKTKTPLVFEKTVVFSPEGGIWLDVERA
nr:cytochrome P450 monooxygenase CYP6SZ2 [Lasioderma serricorne]